MMKTKSYFIDSVPEPGREIDIGGIRITDAGLKVPVTIARSDHVYDYGVVKAVKPFDELKEASAVADKIPVTRDHPAAGLVTDRRQILGFLTNATAENDMLKGILEITEQDLIADIKTGKAKEISPGFFCTLDESEKGRGVLKNGKKYTATQRNIYLNHIAVVEKGRCSIEDGCGITRDTPHSVTPPLIDQDKNNKINTESKKKKAMSDLDHFGDIISKINLAIEMSSSAFDEDILLKELLEEIKAQIQKEKAEWEEIGSVVESVIKNEKDNIINDLLELQSTKTREDYEHLSLDAVKKEYEMLSSLITPRLGVRELKTKTDIDTAYGIKR